MRGAIGEPIEDRSLLLGQCDPQLVREPAQGRPRERFVWDGSQLLYEYRGEGGIFADSTALESQTITNGDWQGTVHYFHAGGIDQPLALWRDGSAGFVPHLSWRGAFERVSRVDGVDAGYYLVASDADAYRGSDARQTPREETYWLGSIVSETVDAGGLVHMRNRYYDPKTGRFTQEDPIGLAGGMNLYGFAGGDPVNSSDPFGLCPDPKPPACAKAGAILTVGVSGFAANQSGGANAQWGAALNLHTGDATIFQTHGNSTGLGGSIGPSFGLQSGSLNSVVAPTGEGGGRSANGAVFLLGGSIGFGDDNKFSGGSLGSGGAGFAINETTGGNTLGIVNVYQPIGSVIAGATDTSRDRKKTANDAVRAMTCPGGCRAP